MATTGPIEIRIMDSKPVRKWLDATAALDKQLHGTLEYQAKLENLIKLLGLFCFTVQTETEEIGERSFYTPEEEAQERRELMQKWAIKAESLRGHIGVTLPATNGPEAE